MINLLYKIFGNSRISNLEFPKNCFLSAGSALRWLGFLFAFIGWLSF
nr:hypothetical protein [uncultured Campylobacter sp.]